MRTGFRYRFLGLAAALVGLLSLLSLAATAQAQAPLDPLGFQIQVPAGGIVVHESAGSAVITVTRDPLEAVAGAQVRYQVSGNGFNPATNAPFDCGGVICTATGDDYTWVQSASHELDFQPGQSSSSFSVPITDHGVTSAPKTFRVSLYGPSPIGLGPVSSATVTILEDDRRPRSSPATRSGCRSRRRGQPGRRRAAVHRSSERGRDRRPAEPGAEHDREPAGNGPVRSVQLHLAVRGDDRGRGVPVPEPRGRRRSRGRFRCSPRMTSCTAPRAMVTRPPR